MSYVAIENIVASTNLAEEFDLKRLAEILPDSKYNTDEFPGLIWHITEPKSAALLFPNGKVICTGAKSMEELNSVIRKITNKINDIGISTKEKTEIKIQNIIASSNLNKTLYLGSIARNIGLDNVEYEPEKFPGLVYKVQSINVVILLFGSGKIICTGAKELEDTTRAIDLIKDKLTSIGML